MSGAGGSAPAPVLMVGLDAADIAVIEALCSDGKLPTLQYLRDRGCFGSLRSDANVFMSGVWTSLSAGVRVPWHGRYFNKIWRQERMRVEIISDGWLPPAPFWHLLDGPCRLALIDIPYTLATPRLRNGIFLNGWETHDLFSRGSWPPALWKRLKREFGAPRNPPEQFGAQSPATLLRLRDDMLQATEQKASICESLLGEGPWDLFFVVFGTVHRGSHFLWDLSQIETARLAPPIRRTLEHALTELFQACDEALARLLAAAGTGTRVIVFAVHGMGPNLGWPERFPAFVSHLQHHRGETPGRTGVAYRLRGALPWKVLRQVTTRLPVAATDALVPLWSSRMFDWGSTRYFPVPGDQNGYLRVNLKGREARGIVEAGAEYEDLCGQLSEAFLELRDLETGEPIVRAVHRPHAEAPPEASFRRLLPDLAVQWNERSARDSVGVRSPFGELRWRRGAKLASGRPGNHLERGWFAAAGPGIEPGSRAEGHQVVDVAPTVLSWLGADVPAHFQGRPIPALARAR